MAHRDIRGGDGERGIVGAGGHHRCDGGRKLTLERAGRATLQGQRKRFVHAIAAGRGHAAGGTGEKDIGSGQQFVDDHPFQHDAGLLAQNVRKFAPDGVFNGVGELVGDFDVIAVLLQLGHHVAEGGLAGRGRHAFNEHLGRGVHGFIAAELDGVAAVLRDGLVLPQARHDQQRLGAFEQLGADKACGAVTDVTSASHGRHSVSSLLIGRQPCIQSGIEVVLISDTGRGDGSAAPRHGKRPGGIRPFGGGALAFELREQPGHLPGVAAVLENLHERGRLGVGFALNPGQHFVAEAHLRGLIITGDQTVEIGMLLLHDAHEVRLLGLCVPQGLLLSHLLHVMLLLPGEDDKAGMIMGDGGAVFLQPRADGLAVRAVLQSQLGQLGVNGLQSFKFALEVFGHLHLARNLRAFRRGLRFLRDDKLALRLFRHIGRIVPRLKICGRGGCGRFLGRGPALAFLFIFMRSGFAGFAFIQGRVQAQREFFFKVLAVTVLAGHVGCFRLGRTLRLPVHVHLFHGPLAHSRNSVGYALSRVSAPRMSRANCARPWARKICLSSPASSSSSRASASLALIRAHTACTPAAPDCLISLTALAASSREVDSVIAAPPSAGSASLPAPASGPTP
nr:MAG TPA: hypothetical protein [Caudoviricetes sp.]